MRGNVAWEEDYDAQENADADEDAEDAAEEDADAAGRRQRLIGSRSHGRF